MAAIAKIWYEEASPPGIEPTIRPFIVLKVPDTTLPGMWETSENIAFFRSSGSSNVGYSHFAGTWLPTFGLGLALETYEEKVNGKKTGRIINAIEQRILKMGHCQKINNAGVEDYRLSARTTRDINQLLIAYIDWLVANNHIQIDIPVEYLNETRSHVKQSIGIRHASRVSEQINNDYIEPVVAFMRDYFLYQWQVQLSYNLGGGIWTNQEAPFGFRLFSAFCSERFNGGNLYNYEAILISINNDDVNHAGRTELKYDWMVEWLFHHHAQPSTYTRQSPEITKIPCRHAVSPFEPLVYNGHSSKYHIFNILLDVLTNAHNGGKRIFLRRPSTFSSKTKKRKNRKLFRKTLSSRSKKHKKNQFKH